MLFFRVQGVEQKAQDDNRREPGEVGGGAKDGFPKIKAFGDRQISIKGNDLNSSIENDEGVTFRLLRNTAAGSLSAEQLAQLQFVESDIEGKKAAILLAEDNEDLRKV